jgi:hypothetical protein
MANAKHCLKLAKRVLAKPPIHINGSGAPSIVATKNTTTTSGSSGRKHDNQHHSNSDESNRRAQKFENWFARRLALVALLSGVSSDLFSIGLIVGI